MKLYWKKAAENCSLFFFKNYDPKYKRLVKKNSIVCFGEVLWDIFPTHKVAGGAPMNVAFHANNFGVGTQMISAIGNDELGKALISFLQHKNINTDLIHTNYTFPTSTVQVTLNEKGSASYEIIEPVAFN